VQSWTERLWAEAQPVYEAILVHPFLTGLTDATLPPETFAEYVAQDAHYLRDYGRALAVVGSKAPTPALTALFATHAAETAQVELALHATLLPMLGLDPDRLDEVVPSPTTVAYTSYLLRTAHAGTYAEGLAAVLPCYWIYQRVGDALVAQGSPDPRYQRWIDTYAGEAFGVSVRAALAAADEAGAGLAEAEEATARGHFRTTTRYEWMFWDAAYRREQWPV
jgi:thiaminase/transcriptional activator TenA